MEGLTLLSLLSLSLLPLYTGGQNPAPVCIDPQGTCACNTDQGMINLAPLDSKDPANPK